MECPDLDCLPIESMLVKVRLSNYKHLYICSLYVPCNCSPDTLEAVLYKLSNLINISDSDSSFVICGDFNLPTIDWSDVSHPLATRAKDRLLISFMELCSLSQRNTIVNHTNNLLDLVLSNIDHSSLIVNNSLGFVTPDLYHPPLEISLEIQPSINARAATISKRNFYRTDFESLSYHLEQIDWSSKLRLLNSNEAASVFYHMLIRLIDEFVPMKVPAKRSYPVWFTSVIINTLKLKDKFHKKFKLNNSPDDYRKFVYYRNSAKKEIDSAFKNYVKNLEDSLYRNDTKPFWAHVKRSRNSAPASISFDGRTEVESQAMSDLFAEYFNSTYSTPSGTLNYDFRIPMTDSLSDITFSPDEVLLCMRSLDASVNGGPDTIPNSFVKTLAIFLSEPLGIIYNKSMAEGVFPSVWKDANVIPILKTGDITDAKNYRPISTLNCFGKIFERLVYNRVFESISNLIASQQHGFVSGKSTASNLMEFTNFVSQSLEQHGQVDVIYTDLTKAFDRVNHKILLSKLEKYGVTGNLLRWFNSYLNNRKMRVVFNGCKSQAFSPNSGVPQGSILGPLLFLIYINDLPQFLASDNLLYADDLKLFKVINSESDCSTLQNDLEVLLEWCQLNDLGLNVNKCFKVTYTLKKTHVNKDYHIDDKAVREVNKIKDLGVTFDSKLKFDSHYGDISNRAYRMSGFILRVSSSFNSIRTSVLLFKSLVRSILEYGSSVWNPHHDCHKKTIESVQRKFTRSLFFKFRKPYVDYDLRLSELHMPSLEKRRIYLDACTLYNIVNGILRTALVNELSFRNPAFNSRSTNVFAPRRALLSVFYYSPLIRMQRNHDFFQFGQFNISAYRFKNELKQKIF